MTDVAKHNSASSCWTVVNGSVYDVTSWINRHPGGAGAILSMCGTDASNAFDDQHGGQRRPEQELASFFIGKRI
jgi:cytochrome b involved in lipid metabolism